MTEKRFTETLSTGIVTDNVTGKEYKCEMRIDDGLLNLLNELHEENERLKEEKQLLYEDIDFLRIFIEKQGFIVKLDNFLEYGVKVNDCKTI